MVARCCQKKAAISTIRPKPEATESTEPRMKQNYLLIPNTCSVFVITILLVFLCVHPGVAKNTSGAPQSTPEPTTTDSSGNLLSTDAQNYIDADFSAYKKSKFAAGKFNDLVKNGIMAFHAQNYEIAYKNLFTAYNQGCQSPIVLFMLALISEYNESYFSAVEMYQLARKGFDVANQDHRFNTMFYENYGRALYFSGRVDEARPVLQKAAKKTKSFWLLKLMGMLAFDQGDTLNAVAYFERAVRISSPDVTSRELVDIYITLARLFDRQNEPDGAKRYYYQVLQIDPQNAEASQYMRGLEKKAANNKMQEQLQKMMDE